VEPPCILGSCQLKYRRTPAYTTADLELHALRLSQYVLALQERRRQLEEAQAAAAAENEGRPTASRRTGRTPAVRRGMAGLPATKAGAWRRARGGEQAEGATGAKAGGGSGAGGAAATGGGAE
jgi:hypothetical protein